tara:strand:- start:965 stop:1381 length:417 start_codon:yes stop_codon:yes gene_type:complete
MNQVIVWLVLFFTGLFAASSQNTINIEMYNLDNNEGTIQIGLYDSEGNFLNKTFRSLEAEIVNQKSSATFQDVPDGIYAISLYHDEDNDKELDKFLNTIPTEDYGTSNNAPARFGPPKWKDAKFEVKNGETITQKISL